MHGKAWPTKQEIFTPTAARGTQKEIASQEITVASGDSTGAGVTILSCKPLPDEDHAHEEEKEVELKGLPKAKAARSRQHRLPNSSVKERESFKDLSIQDLDSDLTLQVQTVGFKVLDT